MRRLKAGILSLALATFASSTLANTIKISTTVPETSNWMEAANTFKEIVESKTPHTVQIYPNGVLASGNDRVELEMAQAGAVDIIMKTTIWLSQLNQDFLVTAMPWMFPNAEVAMEVMDGPTGQQLSTSLNKVGLEALAWGDGGFFQLYSKKGPIKTPNDIAGVKIRVPGNPIFVKTWNGVGAEPTPISFSEIFSSLQSGAIDGGVATTPLIYAKRFYEVAPYVSVINFSFESVGMIANKAMLDGLSEADQDIIKQAAIEGMKAQRALALKENSEYLTKMTAAGSRIYVPTDEELSQFKQIAQPIYDQFKESVGSELVTKVEEEVKALTK
ncbi:TRAP transporter substrate-binding protein [Psychromonas sp. 14N.309.X.WAT.B.A12]|uniref:TRAP transporter substrate-binding protein n=1 Tax=Psychromonas sp. 14N.309.X.WAT.B.A12 TaxID=2998322 RepID=UPI0025B1222B|nr:TRAP transporter substrate-binding protein [Psychromonas sp. 14N.309.X.WAT.B.A12]MDN2663263.1 TRAP transporter substrate-binding protein [Psychromonas sp. 14N.309.X.WAT.B.A12]